MDDISCWLIEFDDGSKIILSEYMYKQECDRNWKGRKRNYEAHWFSLENCRNRNRGIMFVQAPIGRTELV